MTAVAIVEPQRMTRLGIEQVIGSSAALRITASVAHLDDLDDVDADVVLLGSRACDGPKAAIRALRQRAGVLMMADTPTSDELLASIHAGAGGFVTSNVTEGELLNAVNAVAAGAFYLMAGLTSHLPQEPGEPERARDKTLARREVETLRLIASGYTHGQIARRMGLTEATVNTYVKRIRTKLCVGNKAELTRKAIDLGYVSSAPVLVETARVRPILTSVPMLDRSA